MLDLRLIRQNPDAVRTALRNRGSDFDISEVLSLDEQVRRSRAEVENLRARRNAIAGTIAKAKREGRDTAADVAEGAR